MQKEKKMCVHFIVLRFTVGKTVRERCFWSRSVRWQQICRDLHSLIGRVFFGVFSPVNPREFSRTIFLLVPQHIIHKIHTRTHCHYHFGTPKTPKFNICDVASASCFAKCRCRERRNDVVSSKWRYVKDAKSTKRYEQFSRLQKSSAFFCSFLSAGQRNSNNFFIFLFLYFYIFNVHVCSGNSMHIVTPERLVFTIFPPNNFPHKT